MVWTCAPVCVPPGTDCAYFVDRRQTPEDEGNVASFFCKSSTPSSPNCPLTTSSIPSVSLRPTAPSSVAVLNPTLLFYYMLIADRDLVLPIVTCAAPTVAKGFRLRDTSPVPKKVTYCEKKNHRLNGTATNPKVTEFLSPCINISILSFHTHVIITCALLIPPFQFRMG